MGDIAQRGNRLTAAKGGRIGKFGGGRTNLLEELGRVEAEPSNRNRRAEISRVHGELNRGYATGGVVREIRKGVKRLGEAAKKHVARKEAAKVQAGKDEIQKSDMGYQKGGRIGLKKGGKPWGTGPKPGTIEFLQHHTQTPKRKGKAIGGAIAKGIGALAKKFKKKKVYPETEDLTHQKGPYVGDVGSEGKKAKKFAKRSHKKEEEAQRKKNIAWPVRGSYAIGGPAARTIKKGIGKALEPRGVFKKDSYRGMERPWEKPPQLRKSQKERREELRKKARKSGGHSKIIFHDEWKHIDPGLQKGLFKKDGGRAGLKKGGKSDKKWIQKAVNPKHKGYCTPMTKKTCTPARKALARTFKKKAKTGWG